MTNTIKVPLIKHCNNIYIFATEREKINFPSRAPVYKQFSGLCLLKQINDYSGFCEHLKATNKFNTSSSVCMCVCVCACACAHTCSLMVFALASNGSGAECTKMDNITEREQQEQSWGRSNLAYCMRKLHYYPKVDWFTCPVLTNPIPW